MTLASWIAGTAWRAALLTAITLAAGWLVPWPQPRYVAVPPVDVDRVVVTALDGSTYEIRDPAQLAEIVQFLHVRRQMDWMRVPDGANPFGRTQAVFYRGEQEQGWMTWGPGGFIAPVDGARGLVRLSDSELESLGWLLDRDGPRAAMAKAAREGRLHVQQSGIMSRD